jgi:hypothetical protein
MNQQLEDLLARIYTLQEEVEETYRQALEEFDRQRGELADEFLRRQRRYKIGLLRFIARAQPLVILTVPLIYAGWIPFLLMDLFVTLYQASCFPIYGIPKVRRGRYLVFDREGLPYLNLIERINCFYCSYANGVAGYTREVAARTEQYWCPIKHARRLTGAHDYYPKFFDYGDAAAYRDELARLRRDYAELRASQSRE